MAERGSRKIPVTEREFLWVQDDDKGEVVLHVGPTMVSPTAADRVVCDDGEGGFTEDSYYRPQKMIELSDHQYGVLYNPLLEPDQGPNGRFKPGRNESRPLRNGTRSMIPGPCSFYLRPGQRCEVRDAHELASNQYLVVKVYGDVDESAPYYAITQKSAGILEATAADVGGSSSAMPADKGEELHRGQLIVIRGLDTQFYIPPTGVDIVPDTSSDSSGMELSADAARHLIGELKEKAEAEAVRRESERRQAEEEQVQAQEEMQKKRRRKSKAAPPPVQQAARFRQRAVPAGAPPQAQAAIPVNLLAESAALRRTLEKKARSIRLIREAVVLGEKEFCVIIDADGKRQIHVGPARVFPGPYDQFQTAGSRDRVYDAYELLPQRALWLRVISKVSKKELAGRFPQGFELSKEVFHPGDEILLTGVSGFFFPFNEIEVLSPDTGLALIGNDHTQVFIEAIGIDQKSGIYVRDLTTGEVRLVRGKQTYLVDPRKEIHITRTVNAKQWNLWIAPSEQHKVAREPIVTPWAVSVIVPHKSAVMAASADGHRVIEGPCVTLLSYEETLVPLRLSTGTPKREDELIETCFLRTTGNRVSDEIVLESADFVEFRVRVSYHVSFLPEQRDRWFNHPNYVQVLIEHLRSKLRGVCRQKSLTSVWPTLADTIRDTVLGLKTDKGRKGCRFAENGMTVYEVEVLSAEIVDQKIANLMASVQSDLVALQIADRRAKEELASTRLRATLELERQRIEEAASKRAAELDRLKAELAKAARLHSIQAEAEAERTLQELAAQREHVLTEARLSREQLTREAGLLRIRAEAEAKADASRLQHAEDLEYRTAMRDLEVKLIAARAKATVDERLAVQPGLIEAIAGVGDKQLLAEVANNMNLVSLFKGKDVGQILSDVLGGTGLMPAVRGMIERAGKVRLPQVKEE